MTQRSDHLSPVTIGLERELVSRPIGDGGLRSGIVCPMLLPVGRPIAWSVLP